MPIDVKTVYTKEILLRFIDAMGKRRFFLWLMLAAGSALVIGFSVSAALIAGWTLELILYIVFALLWDVLGVFMTFGLPRLTINKNPLLNATVEYSFHQDHFQIHGDTLFSMEMSKNQYSILQGVIKSGNDLYLIFAPQQGCIVDLQNLSRAQVSKLHRLFESKFPANRIQWKD